MPRRKKARDAERNGSGTRRATGSTGGAMFALVLAMMTLAQEPGLLPRKPPSSQSHVNEGPVAPPVTIPDEPAAPPVIVDDDKPAAASPAAPAQPPHAAPRSPVPRAPEPSAPADAARNRSAARPAVSGEWLQTRQDGWIWMPHADAYYHVPASGRGRPYAYAYDPERGWAWVEAPWIWGIGPWPRFGEAGATRFAWYQAGYWRTPWRWEYWPARDRSAPAR
jgi:hypothetical protein